ncbi:MULTISPECIES: MliC family protein [Halocynthiibacter]|uniref:MliC family protein n=1 Tax=Halocynthiibacter halioticoli TaxID=2986804 RepID=A0AAE3LUE6_9RHOB|nr:MULTISPECIES: MliC family protein [Halocynthiibacter]MCV6823890.1 MliC family protein [Halocynthiibacter halioticoli]MCW4056891.1 MliC family protein [Halocynthiibacter sp. SDUM655004]
MLPKIIPAIAACAITLSVGFAPVSVSAEASGPDYYRVTGVSADDVLNIRAQPKASATKVGQIPANGDGLQNLGCVGEMSFAEWEKASEAERAAAAKKRWCEIEYAGTRGWVAGWFLAEGNAPAQVSGSKPAFDCAKASSEVENAICADPRLGQLDQELSRVYNLAVNGPNMTADRLKELKAYQRGWIKGRDECWKSQSDLTDCVVDNYALRINEIRTGYADARADDASGVSVGPFPYVCDGLTAVVSVGFVNVDPGVVTLRWADNAVALDQVQAASGAKYEGETYRGKVGFWSKGDEAIFSLSDRGDMQCKQDAMG